MDNVDYNNVDSGDGFFSMADDTDNVFAGLGYIQPDADVNIQPLTSDTIPDWLNVDVSNTNPVTQGLFPPAQDVFSTFSVPAAIPIQQAAQHPTYNPETRTVNNGLVPVPTQTRQAALGARQIDTDVRPTRLGQALQGLQTRRQQRRQAQPQPQLQIQQPQLQIQQPQLQPPQLQIQPVQRRQRTSTTATVLQPTTSSFNTIFNDVTTVNPVQQPFAYTGPRYISPTNIPEHMRNVEPDTFLERPSVSQGQVAMTLSPDGRRIEFYDVDNGLIEGRIYLTNPVTGVMKHVSRDIIDGADIPLVQHARYSIDKKNLYVYFDISVMYFVCVYTFGGTQRRYIPDVNMLMYTKGNVKYIASIEYMTSPGNQKTYTPIQPMTSQPSPLYSLPPIPPVAPSPNPTSRTPSPASTPSSRSPSPASAPSSRTTSPQVSPTNTSQQSPDTSSGSDTEEFLARYAMGGGRTFKRRIVPAKNKNKPKKRNVRHRRVTKKLRKPIAKKQDKKPTAKKPVSKRPAAKKQVKKPSAKKPISKTQVRKPAAKKPVSKTQVRRPAAKKLMSKKQVKKFISKKLVSKQTKKRTQKNKIKRTIIT